jgi:hypothetical protein
MSRLDELRALARLGQMVADTLTEEELDRLARIRRLCEAEGYQPTRSAPRASA